MMKGMHSHALHVGVNVHFEPLMQSPLSSLLHGLGLCNCNHMLCHSGWAHNPEQSDYTAVNKVVNP